MTTALNVQDLALTIGELPGGDTPAAWFASMTDPVIDAYERYLTDQLQWNRRYAHLLSISDLPPTTQFVTEGSRGSLIGLVAPVTPQGGGTPPRWWRRGPGGHLIPRRRTQAEKNSDVSVLFKELAVVPRPIDYVPGMPKTLFLGDLAYAPQVRRPAQAVLCFLAVDPDLATQPFEPDNNWSRMKLSTFHALKERQQAAHLV